MGFSTNSAMENASKILQQGNQGENVYRPEVFRPFDQEQDYPIFLEHCLTKAGDELRKRIGDFKNPNALKTLNVSLLVGVDFQYRDYKLGKGPQSPPLDVALQLAREVKERVSEVFAQNAPDLGFSEKVDVLVVQPPQKTPRILLRAKDSNIALDEDFKVIVV